MPLRDAILRTGGIGLADGSIHPADLVAIGVATAEEAEELAAMHPNEKTSVRPCRAGSQFQQREVEEK